jgi:hypothetical protein
MGDSRVRDQPGEMFKLTGVLSIKLASCSEFIQGKAQIHFRFLSFMPAPEARR